VLKTKPASCMFPVAPEKEPRRVAPPELKLFVEPEVTVAVAVEPPEVPPPDPLHS